MEFANVPICDDCWYALNEKRVPIRLKKPEEEQCHYCHQPTTSGLMVRANVE
jgi:hypothetical protein